MVCLKGYLVLYFYFVLSLTTEFESKFVNDGSLENTTIQLVNNDGKQVNKKLTKRC